MFFFSFVCARCVAPYRDLHTRFAERSLPGQNLRAELAACWFRAQAIRCQFIIDENQVAEGFPKPQTHLRSATSRQVSFFVCVRVRVE